MRHGDNGSINGIIAGQALRTHIDKLKGLFKLHCPLCGGEMKVEMFDMELDRLVYKCKKCGKEWI